MKFGHEQDYSLSHNVHYSLINADLQERGGRIGSDFGAEYSRKMAGIRTGKSDAN